MTEVNTGDDEEHKSRSTDVVTYYYVNYYNILDTVIMNLNQRVSKESMILAKNLTFINHYKVSESIFFFKKH